MNLRRVIERFALSVMPPLAQLSQGELKRLATLKKEGAVEPGMIEAEIKLYDGLMVKGLAYRSTVRGIYGGAWFSYRLTDKGAEVAEAMVR